MGMVESFNVSVACAVILVEAQRQRLEAGLYSKSRMDSELYKTRLFRWCQPIVTEFCDERGLAYPAIDEEGEIIEPASWYRDVREGVAPMALVTEQTA